MLALKPFTEDHGRAMVLPFVTGGCHLSGSLRLNGFAAHRLAYLFGSLVRVSRRVGWRAQYARVPRAQVPEGPPSEPGARFVPRPRQRHRGPTKPALAPPRWPTLTSAPR